MVIQIGSNLYWGDQEHRIRQEQPHHHEANVFDSRTSHLHLRTLSLFDGDSTSEFVLDYHHPSRFRRLDGMFDRRLNRIQRKVARSGNRVCGFDRVIALPISKSWLSVYQRN